MSANTIKLCYGEAPNGIVQITVLVIDKGVITIRTIAYSGNGHLLFGFPPSVKSVYLCWEV